MKRIGLPVLTTFMLIGCQPSEDSIATAIQQTAGMQQTLEPTTATHTELPPTATLIITPSATASLEPTATLPAHPIRPYDEFWRNWGNWID